MKKILVISAPSGAGKTTLIQKISQQIPLRYSISHTTRAPRKGEEDGQHYHFVSKEEFFQLKDTGFFLEDAEIYGHYYATSWSNILNHTADDQSWLLLDLDPQGYFSLIEKIQGIVSVFILPPSLEALRFRILHRQSDICPHDLELRLSQAAQEMSYAKYYQYQILNDDVNDAAAALLEIMRNAACSHSSSQESA